MTPDDPRHGTTGGAMQHYHDGEKMCDPCRLAKNRAHKLNKYRRDNGDPGLISHTEVAEVIAPWRSMGFTPTAIFRAAGCAAQYGGNAFHSGRSTRRDTFARLQLLADDQFMDTDLVYADLTRRRIYSLRAAGHSLVDMPIDPQGVWRTSRFVTVGVARAMREFFQANEMRLGSNRNGAARAINQGHRPPLSWDDPGTLAWIGAPPPLPRRSGVKRRPADDLDPVIVQRLLDLERVPESTRAERTEALRRWLAAGGSERRFCKEHEWRFGRYTPRKDDAA